MGRSVCKYLDFIFVHVFPSEVLFLMCKVFCSYRPDRLFLRALIRILIHRWMKTDIPAKYQSFFRNYHHFCDCSKFLFVQIPPNWTWQLHWQLYRNQAANAQYHFSTMHLPNWDWPIREFWIHPPAPWPDFGLISLCKILCPAIEFIIFHHHWSHCQQLNYCLQGLK